MKLTVVAVEQIGSRTNVPFCNDADLAAIVLYASVCVCVCIVRASNSRFDAASVNNRIPRSINAFHREEARVNVSFAD